MNVPAHFVEDPDDEFINEDSSSSEEEENTYVYVYVML